jgi:hypothetical protein
VKHQSLVVPGLLVAALAAVSAGCGERPNPVADYFDNVELQCETETQRQVVIGALGDILALGSNELGTRRYPDYRGTPDALDLPALITRHFVPDAAGKSLGPHFYHDVKSPRAQRLVRRLLDRLTGEDSTGPA